jgi:hypothetical protein
MVGAALLARARPTEDDAGAAVQELAWVAAGGAEPGAPGVPGPTRAEGWLGLLEAARRLGTLDAAIVRLQGALGQPPFTVEGRADPLLMVLAHDAMTRALFEAGLGATPPDRALLERALGVQEQLFSRTDLGFDASTLRPIGAEKLALLASHAGPGVALPAGYTLARAIVLARDDAGGEEAARLFTEIAADPAAGATRADALWELAVLRTRPGRPDGAAETRAAHAQAVAALLRLASEFPSHARAPQAIGAAVEFARELDARAEPSGRELYRRALVLATDRYSGHKDAPRWVYERLRLDLQGAPDTAELSAALARLRAIHPGGPLEADLVRVGDRGHAALMGALWDELRRRRAAGAEPALRAWAAAVLVPEARRAAEWAATHGAPSRMRFEADAAMALTESGDPAGLPTLKRLSASGPTPAADSSGGAQGLRLALARSMLLAGETAGAFDLLADIASALDAPPAAPGAPARSDAFWQAWTLMLETLVNQDRAGAQRGAIRAHITRLRAIDAALGGPPWRARIEAVAARVPD